MQLSGWLFALLAALVTAPAMSQDTVCSNFIDTPLLAPQPASIEGASSHTYKTIADDDLRLHVFSDGTPAEQPALVFFFGGGWNWGNVTDFRALGEHFAARGMRSILVEYRTFCRQGVSVADEVEDAKSAIRWIRRHADELDVDPARIAVSGASSGGHLALGTAMFDDRDSPDENPGISSKPNLLLLFYPCVDLTLDLEMEYSSQVIATHGHDLSPLFHIPDDLPPLIIFQGATDPLYASVKQFCDDARSLGNACEFIEYAEAGHGFMNQRSAAERAQAEATVREMERFLTEAAYLGSAEY